jgi:adenosine deaminase
VAAASIFRDLASQNVRYVEISFDVERVARQALPLADVVAAITRAAPPGLRLCVFGGFSYHKADRTPTGLIDAVLSAPGLDGIDLHGDEGRRTTASFAVVFHEARRRGLTTKAHARGSWPDPTRSPVRSTCSASDGSSPASGRSRTNRCSRAWPPTR